MSSQAVHADGGPAIDWPSHLDRTPADEREPYPGEFLVPRKQAFLSIVDELERWEATEGSVRVESASEHYVDDPNVPHQHDKPDDVGVAVYFRREDGPADREYAVACDRWETQKENARSIALWAKRHRLAEFLEDLGAADDGIADAVRIPDLDPEDRSNDTKLHREDALALIQFYRNSDERYGTRAHAFLELAWFTGARQGGLRALDLRDAELGDQPYVDFRHRPDTGTPLKNKLGGERPVAIRPETSEVVRTYLRTDRYDVHDDHGRQPLLASMRGRPGENTIRVWSYIATQPCLHDPCPHGQERPSCEWTEYGHASKCPSSRSPHHIRTGTITWLLNRGWPPEDVSERVNATVKTIEQHYDKADPEERRRRLRDRMEQRRRPLLEELAI